MEHADTDVAVCNRSTELFLLTNGVDEVCEMGIGHRIATDEIGRGRFAARVPFAYLFPGEVVDFVAVAIDQDCAGRAHDRRSAIAAVVFHALTALSFPCDKSVVILETRHERVVKLPIVFKVISSTRGGDSLWIVDA